MEITTSSNPNPQLFLNLDEKAKDDRKNHRLDHGDWVEFKSLVWTAGVLVKEGLLRAEVREDGRAHIDVNLAILRYLTLEFYSRRNVSAEKARQILGRVKGEAEWLRGKNPKADFTPGDSEVVEAESLIAFGEAEGNPVRFRSAVNALVTAKNCVYVAVLDALSEEIRETASTLSPGAQAEVFAKTGEVLESTKGGLEGIYQLTGLLMKTRKVAEFHAGRAKQLAKFAETPAAAEAAIDQLQKWSGRGARVIRNERSK